MSINVVGTDYTDLFTTNEWFDSKDALIGWVRRVANENRVVVVIKRLDGGAGKRKARVYIGCELGGTFREWKGKKNRFKPSVDEDSDVKSNVDSGSRKRGCPFLLKGEEININGPWALEVKNAVHDHLLPEYFEGHAYVQRLSKEQEDFVVRLSLNNVRLKNILQELKEKFSDSPASIKTLYNARQRCKIADRAGRSQMQYLLGKLEEYGYYSDHRRCEATREVKDLFFAHPTSIELLKAFPQVILMDCTY